MDNYSVAFSYHPDLSIKGTLHKYGHLDYIHSWADNTRRVYRESGFHEEANEIVVMDGISQEEIDNCINFTGYVAGLYERKIKELKLDEKVLYHTGDDQYHDRDGRM